jgi:hypothetical protein
LFWLQVLAQTDELFHPARGLTSVAKRQWIAREFRTETMRLTVLTLNLWNVSAPLVPRMAALAAA